MSTTIQALEQRVPGTDATVEHPFRPPPVEQHDVPWRDLQLVTKFAALVTIVAGFWYLSFLFDRRHENIPMLWMLNVCAELIIVFHTLGVLLTLLPYRSDIPEPDSVSVLRRALITGEVVTPTVDVFICHATEPLHMVLPTIIAARDMQLPHNVWVLDDGRDPLLREACLKLGVGYVKRTSNSHAKAGNVNSAFARTSGQYVVVLDADHIPRPDLLVQTLPYLMSNPTIAMVQTPQTYLYEGRGMIAEGAAVSQELFYQAMMPAKNASNSTFCVGTNVVFRRAALETLTEREKTPREKRRDKKKLARGEPIEPALTELGHEFPKGGIWVGSNSEDIWTSLQLHIRGWRTVFLPKVLTQGLTPDTIAAFMKQQFRWSCGGYEILLWGRIFRQHRLTLTQKFQYLLVMTHYLQSFSLAIFVFLSPIYLLTDQSPISSSFINWAVHFIPFYVLVFMVPIIQSGKLCVSAIVVSIAAVPAHIKGFYGTLLRQKTSWSVTNGQHGGFSMRMFLPHCLVLIVNILSVCAGLTLGGQELTAQAISIGFVFTVMALGVLLFVGSERADRLAAKADKEAPTNEEAIEMLDEYLALERAGAFR